MCKVFVHLIAKLLIMLFDFEVINIIYIILNLYNLAKDYLNSQIKEKDVGEIKNIFYINSL